MNASLMPLDDHEDIKNLLIYFAFFAFSFERLVGKLAELNMAITNHLSTEERTGGQWINQIHKLFENNLSLSDADKAVWYSIRKRLWDLNENRIKLLKGVKYYQKATDDRGVSVVTYELSKDSPERQPRTKIHLAQIYELLDECSHLELVFEFLIKCINKRVSISDVFTEEGGKYTINLHPLGKEPAA